MSQKSTLRAMKQNYTNGHCWDHLDGEVVEKAADEIERLEGDLNEAVKLLSEAHEVIKLLIKR